MEETQSFENSIKTTNINTAEKAKGVIMKTLDSSLKKLRVKWKKWRMQGIIHLRRNYVMILNLLLGHDLIFSFIGWFASSVLKRPIRSVFLLYPGHKKYSEAYVYDWYRKQMQWKPRLIGFLWQSGGIALTFAISACDQDIWSDKGDNLKKVYDRIEDIRDNLCAKQKTFAGILPGVFNSKGIAKEFVEVQVTVPAIIKAIDMVKAEQSMPPSTMVIVLGGAGFIGAPLVNALKETGKNAVISIDLNNTSLLNNLEIEHAVLVNITKRGGLKQYIPNLHDNIVVLNEVYPPPRKNVVEAIKKQGSKIYHINGLAGGAIPSFPHDYAGGIPCCAGHIPENFDEFNVLISEM